MIEKKDIVAYLDKVSVSPGDFLDIMASTTSSAYHSSLVRLVSGDSRPHGTGFREKIIEKRVGTHVGREQSIEPGSYAVLPDIPALESFSFSCWIYPTVDQKIAQTIVRAPGFSLTIEGGELVTVSDTQRVSLEKSLRLRRWHRVVLTENSISFEVKGEGTAEADHGGAKRFMQSLQSKAGNWILADKSYNGRIESPCVEGIGFWDFSREMSSSRIIDISGNGRDGTLFQTPTRAVKGSSWDATVQDWKQDPTQYNAIHFHDDDLTDAGWSADFRWTVPQLPSGLYALKLETADSEDYLPFVVRGNGDANIVFLASTATYLAYANQIPSRVREENAEYLQAHPEVGLSLYSYHRDGSGAHYSSRNRPVLNLKPKTIPWSFNADTNLTAWLEQTGLPFDVITDEDLHLRGAKALDGYSVVVTGSHPEYFSTSMLNALETYLDESGRLMYMGGNGFYWRIAFDPENPSIIEVRRAEDGTRAWIAEPGEYYHSFTGEYGGMWRRLGRTPNRLVGVGFSAQGFDGGTYYRLQEGASDPRGAFVMEGVESPDVIGNYGTQAGGAAGEEIDRYDVTLGSPEHAIVIASSERHKPGMLRVIEETHMMAIPVEDPKTRADMVFFETTSGGAVFSTGSISYAGSLSVNDYNNDIETMTRNVLDRFADGTPFEFPE